MGGGWGFSEMEATLDHVAGSFNLSMAITWDVWIVLSFHIWGYVLHVANMSESSLFFSQ